MMMMMMMMTQPLMAIVYDGLVLMIMAINFDDNSDNHQRSR